MKYVQFYIFYYITVEHSDRKHDRQTHTNLTGSGLFGALTTHDSTLSSRNMILMVSYGVATVLAVSYGLNKMVLFVVLFNSGIGSCQAERQNSD